MPKAVRRTIIEVIQEKGGASEEEARKLLSAMEKRKRYCVESWS
jgi:sulfite reductase alpha subunit-like flavoprotein